MVAFSQSWDGSRDHDQPISLYSEKSVRRLREQVPRATSWIISLPLTAVWKERGIGSPHTCVQIAGPPLPSRELPASGLPALGLRPEPREMVTVPCSNTPHQQPRGQASGLATGKAPSRVASSEHINGGSAGFIVLSPLQWIVIGSCLFYKYFWMGCMCTYQTF